VFAAEPLAHRLGAARRAAPTTSLVATAWPADHSRRFTCAAPAPPLHAASDHHARHPKQPGADFRVRGRGASNVQKTGLPPVRRTQRDLCAGL